ncbi:hypothetical protein L7F22_042550 [Adiantum nelumboides]|nr:hypothetical protein [Adiantum nelumboides]
MAQYNEDPLRRTDANEVRFQETVPDDKKYASTEEGIKSLPKGGQDVGIHIDKPTSVTETGYGGISGRGNDISDTVNEAHARSPKLDHKGGESFPEKAKDVACGVKDLVSGKKQEEAAVPVVDQGNRAHGHHEEGMGEKVKDFVTGQKPGHGARKTDGEEWPAREEVPSATYTDSHGQPVEGPRDDGAKKEGVMSKVMDKFNLGTANKGTE